MPESTGRFGPLVGAIDEGTSSARFLVFSVRRREVVASHQIEIKNIYPQEGWVEQDAKEILKAVHECIIKTIEKLKAIDIDKADIKAIGITNQRETTLVWDKETGEPLHNAIVWLDMRTTTTIENILDNVPNNTRNKNYLKPLCGLPISPYFSALKIRWLIDNVPRVKQAVEAGRCAFGTVDTWLIWNLTQGKLHMTDVSNASRTMLMNIETLKWDPLLCRFFGIPLDILPEIRSCSEIYGHISYPEVLSGIPISGCVGDQQGALIGQLCLKRGQAKATYGTGCFLLYNTGNVKVDSSQGLITTVAYKLGRSPAVYALEGSVAVAGAALSWLRDNIQLMANVTESQDLAERVRCSGDVYFVPAFSGLYAPYWQQDARGVICGITEDTQQYHIIRAALEAVCFQTRDILEAMLEDAGTSLTELQVDGGMTANNLLMQLQADLTGVSVVRPNMVETTALGAAILAGVGIGLLDINDVVADQITKFSPQISDDERDLRYSKWKMAIDRSMKWDSSSAPIDGR
ncbi:glycerol kinase [Neodiprion pinetum]|uniref:Probable glycerol kinase n=1 Tax=Neodiprion lecontei TaxID=441921 RepID=A0A6J0BQP8_NEOLC|nr:glycerol kinase [Neodiprion lecontei]XP_046412870.1 glycerol kinase [Neodiprion fabricii]XP_046470451.1 glycerol kinase [Neodiprion pinetum]XP_046606018.1 glycerol kinase [Neodiprion virginianus]